VKRTSPGADSLADERAGCEPNRDSMTHVLSTEPTTLPQLLLTRAGELGDEPFVRDRRRA
jgi:hypothetical protein